MLKKGRTLYIGILLVIMIILLGYFRDYLFKSINYYIKQAYYNLDTDYNLELYNLVKTYSAAQLKNLKWLLTFLFMGANYGLSFGILKTIFKESRTTISLLSYGYVFLFLLSALLYIGGNLFGYAEVGYTLSRRFMGVLQSPVPLMVVTAVHLLFGRSR